MAYKQRQNRSVATSQFFDSFNNNQLVASKNRFLLWRNSGFRSSASINKGWFGPLPPIIWLKTHEPATSLAGFGPRPMLKTDWRSRFRDADNSIRNTPAVNVTTFSHVDKLYLPYWSQTKFIVIRRVRVNCMKMIIKRQRYIYDTASICGPLLQHDKGLHQWRHQQSAMGYTPLPPSVF